MNLSFPKEVGREVREGMRDTRPRGVRKWKI